ncbi:MAG TPA: MFS transporter [Gemmatimonadales bacterium]|nr:MFS transporter [Gemmatimonadales bacterium]
MTAAALPGRNGSPLDRFLRLFSDVRPGEGATAVILTANIFLLLSAYYVIKPVREALILSSGGAEIKSYASAGQAILLLGLVPLYGLLADHLPRRRLLNVVTAFFVACLVGFWALARAKAPVGVPFFLWVGIFNLMVVAQFWSFANDLYTKDQGERLFPIVGFGASIGAVAGSLLTSRLIPLLGIPELLLVAAGFLVLALVLSQMADSRERRRNEQSLPSRLTTAELPAATGEYQILSTAEGPRVTVSVAGATTGRTGTFGLVFADRYLLLIALLMLVLNWVNTTGEYILGSTVANAAAQAVATGTAHGLDKSEYIGEFYSRFFGVVNIVGVVLQLFVVSRLLKYAGVRVAVMVLPFIAALGYSFLAFAPILAVVRWVKTAENATDYSLQNTVRNVLFLPTSRDQKYKAKQAIDSFFVRAGDVLSALLIFIGTSQLAFGPSQFARVNLVLALVWLGLAFAVGRAYRQKTAPGGTA